MAGPGRPVSRPRGRLPANWSQRMALQEGQVESIKIPKKRGPKPGSKVTTHTQFYFFRYNVTNPAPGTSYFIFMDERIPPH